MTVQREIYKVERIVAVRFARTPGAVPPAIYAPDPDDRGFVRYHGPVVGVCRTDTTRIRLVRDLLDDNAPLFVTSEDPAKLTIVSPAAGVALANGHEVDIEFRAAATDGDVKIQVRAQRRDGPIVGELTVHVSQLIHLRCAVHRTAIYTPPATRTAANTTTRTFADIVNVMNTVNRMWRPMGIEFTVTDRRDNTNLTNQVPRSGVNPVDGTLLCPIFGGGETNENFNRLMATNYVNARLNLYFARGIQAANPGGGAGPNYIGFGSSFHRGVVIADNIGDVETTAHTIAHELGHILTLAASGHTNQFDSHSDDAPQWNATIARRRHDLWSRRRLMYYMVGLQAAERTGAGGRYAFDGTDTGYGVGRSGHLLTIKNLSNQGDPTDNEYTDARRSATAYKSNGQA